MECPKCHRSIADNATTCPHCHKVLTLVCPNCRTLGQNPVCEKCGYIILEKCAKCGRMVSTTSKKCKCGFPVSSTVACQECETDEFASVTIKFGALKSIRRILGSQELYTKFLVKLKNLLAIHFKGIEGKVIVYSDTIFVVNFNKELSFATSVNKAVRFALKIINTFSGINLNVIEELGTPLKLGITIVKKSSEELLQNKSYESNLKLLTVKRDEKRYLRGMQVILDEYSRDCVEKDYKTDSLYSVEQNGSSTMFYEIILQNYILPPNEKTTDEPVDVKKNDISKKNTQDEVEDIYSFKVFDINAKCNFKKSNAAALFNILDENKIISIRGDKEYGVKTSEIADFYEAKGYKVIRTTCTEELNYKPWGVLEQIFRDCYGLSVVNNNFPKDFVDRKIFEPITDLLFGKVRTASTSEDARFAYMEDFIKFLSSLRKYVIIIDGFENIDDTTIQTLNLYFDNFQKIVPNFVFITNTDVSLHSKIHGLLRTNLYTEIAMQKTSVDTILGQLSDDASDFIQSFYYEKIKENYRGSLLYFDNAIKLLKEKDVLISFENKLLIKNSNSVIIPVELEGLLRSRLKHLSKNVDASMILAYSVYLGPRLDTKLLESLGVKDIDKNSKFLKESGFIDLKDDFIYINNYNLIKPVLTASIKKETEKFLIKNIMSKIGRELDITTLLLMMGKVEMFKEECKFLWENSQYSMSTGDYDAYLKNCLGYLSIIEHTDDSLSQEEIENNKKEVFQNILMSLYSYSPEKIYSIENILLIDAMKEDDNEKIIKLSNLMLQGALISSNYTDAMSLLHNILSRMQNPTLIVDGAVNSRFLLLSLVNIEILFNIGEFTNCIETAQELLSVIKPDIIDKIKPKGFSVSLFVDHMLDTFRLACLAKLIAGDVDNIEEYIQTIETSLGTGFQDREGIIAIKNYFAGKGFAPSNTEEVGVFSKVIYLILQEFTEHKNNYKDFAQNIYQAKLLASDIHQKQIELFCDLLIAYSYANMEIKQKAEAIYNDVLEISETSAIFNIELAARYFIAVHKLSLGYYEEALIIINDALAQIQTGNNQAKLFFVLFERMFIDLVKSENITSIDLKSEEQKLAQILENGVFAGLIN